MDRPPQRPSSHQVLLDRPPRAAILDSCPARRQGVIVALRQSGFLVDDPDDPVEWAVLNTHERIVVLELSSASCDETALCRLQDFCLRGVVVVAISTNSSTESYRRLLNAGAGGVVDEHDELGQIVAVVQAALHRQVLLPVSVARALVSRMNDRLEPESEVMSGQEVRWLRALSEGDSVGDLAATSGYSQRQIYRQLRGVYARLGAHNRAQAITRAARSGLLG